MITLTIPQRFELLRTERRISIAARCAQHEFSDEPRDPAKRLRMNEVCCVRCGVIVHIIAAFLYEQGRRHGDAP